MRIAALQDVGAVDRVEVNLERLRDAARRAASAGADVLLSPELFVCGYSPREVHDTDGAAHRKAIAQIAADSNLVIVASTVESDERSKYISASLFDGDGTELTRYRKQNLFDGESDFFEPGSVDPDIVDIGEFRVALGICFDVEFPEFVRRQSVRGATLLLVPTAVPLRPSREGSPLPLDTRVLSTLVVPTRALESQLFIAYANHSGPTFSGTSTIVDPYGRALATAGDDPGFLVADLDPSVVISARQDIGYISRFV